jgi:hypothetical protein
MSAIDQSGQHTRAAVVRAARAGPRSISEDSISDADEYAASVALALDAIDARVAVEADSGGAVPQTAAAAAAAAASTRTPKSGKRGRPQPPPPPGPEPTAPVYMRGPASFATNTTTELGLTNNQLFDAALQRRGTWTSD